MKRRSGNMYWYLLIVGILLTALMWFGDLTNQATQYTKNDLVEDLEAGRVSAVTLEPSRDVPTGTVYVQLGENNSYRFHATDIREIETFIEEFALETQTETVPPSA